MRLVRLQHLTAARSYLKNILEYGIQALCELFHPRMVNARTYLARMNNNRKKEKKKVGRLNMLQGITLLLKAFIAALASFHGLIFLSLTLGYPYGAPYAELVAPAYRLEDKRGLDIQFLKLKTWRDNP